MFSTLQDGLTATPVHGFVMPSCEKCWRDARGDAEEYARLLRERDESGQVCTPEQHAGGDEAETCELCLRKTVHMYSGVCMVDGCGKCKTCKHFEESPNAGVENGWCHQTGEGTDGMDACECYESAFEAERYGLPGR